MTTNGGSHVALWPMSARSITVAFDEDAPENGDDDTPRLPAPGDSGTYVVVQLYNDATFRQLEATLSALDKKAQYPGSVLADYLFGIRQMPKVDQTPEAATAYFNQNLDCSQPEAVDLCTNDGRPIAIVHCPPGTGKTTVVVEIIRQLLRKQKKVLACAPTNVAVDNLLKRLVDACSSNEKESLQFLRLGHPARIDSTFHEYCLDMASSSNSWVDEMDANVVFGTLSSVSSDRDGHSRLDNVRFDVAVIDECGQATELSCWSALLTVGGGKYVLAGDHRQLPPTVLSKEAARGGFRRSLMERAIEELGGDIVTLLTVQYRMNDQIMRRPSDRMYDGRH